MPFEIFTITPPSVVKKGESPDGVAEAIRDVHEKAAAQGGQVVGHYAVQLAREYPEAPADYLFLVVETPGQVGPAASVSSPRFEEPGEGVGPAGIGTR